MKPSVAIPPELHRRLRIQAAIMGIKLGEAAERAVEQWLRQNHANGQPRKREKAVVA